MIYEKWDHQFDIVKLQDHLNRFVLPLKPSNQSEDFGGWSVLSSNGSYTDGWHQGHKVYEDVPKLDVEKVKRATDFIYPTEICHGYMQEVIAFIVSKNLVPHRARIASLAANGSCSWHRDAPDNAYSVRLHIPIETNSGCFFETETERAHLPADGSAYFLFVNRIHRVTNEGNTPRYHLIMDVLDTHGITKQHSYANFRQK